MSFHLIGYGAASVLAGDFAQKLPDGIDFMGLPVRGYGGGFAAMYLVSKMHKPLSLLDAGILAIAARLTATAKSSFMPTTNLTFFGIDMLRAGAGGFGAFGASWATGAGKGS